MNLYQEFGGAEACLKLTQTFYARAAKDPILAPLFPGSLRCAIEGFTAFLTEFLGGPQAYSESRWDVSLREAHQRFKIGEKERYAWLQNMAAALDDIGIKEPVRSALYRFFEESSVHMVNQPATAIHKEVAKRAALHQHLEQLVAAIRANDAPKTLRLIENPEIQTDRKTLVSLLGTMSSSTDTVIVNYVLDKLSTDPALSKELLGRKRTLLHEAAMTGSLPLVERLLELQLDPNATDEGRHTPLYYASTASIVRALIKAGANPDAAEGVKRSTPLHMAARRGNLAVAEALLDCGANPHAKDTNGVTPLQRAINCRKPELIALLRTAMPAGKRL